MVIFGVIPLKFYQVKTQTSLENQTVEQLEVVISVICLGCLDVPGS